MQLKTYLHHNSPSVQYGPHLKIYAAHHTKKYMPTKMRGGSEADIVLGGIYC